MEPIAKEPRQSLEDTSLDHTQHSSNQVEYDFQFFIHKIIIRCILRRQNSLTLSIHQRLMNLSQRREYSLYFYIMSPQSVIN